MNKHQQYAFALLFISLLVSQNIYGQERPKKGPRHSKEAQLANGTNSALETFGAITLSSELEKFPKEFCTKVINRLPDSTKMRINFLINEQKNGEFRGHIILHGPTGSGKSTSAQVILQLIGKPFFIASGSMIANEFQNSGVSGMRRLQNFAVKNKANIIIDEMDSVAQIKSKKNEYQREDETPKAFWEMLDTLGKHKLLLIGTTNEVTGMPTPLQNRLKKNMFEIPYTDQSELIEELITSVLIKNNTILAGPEVMDTLSKMFRNKAIRDINEIVSLAIEYVLMKNKISPILTLEEVMTAWKEIKKNQKLLAQPKWDAKETTIFVCQILGGIAAVGGVAGVIWAIIHGSSSLEIAQKALKISSDSKQIAFYALEHAKEATTQSMGLARENIKIASESLQFNKGNTYFEIQRRAIEIAGEMRKTYGY